MTASVLAVVVASVVVGFAPAGAASLVAGSITITTPGGANLRGGGSETVFSARPPVGARCNGDTAHDSYLVDSYLVRRGTAPTAVNFRGGIPSRGFGFITDGAYYGAVNTTRDTGQLFIFPDRVTWSRLTKQDLFPHGEHSTVWETGIACADRDGVVRRYWNAEVAFTADARDPHGFTWSVLQAAAAGRHSSTRPLGAAVVGIAIVIALFAAVHPHRVRRREARAR